MNKLRSERSLDLIGDVSLDDRLVYLRALVTHVVEIRAQTRLQNLVDQAETERGAQAPGEPVNAAGLARARRLGDGLEGRLHRLGREAHGARAVWVQQQKFDDALGAQVGRVDFAVSFEGSTRLEQTDPVEVVALRRVRDARCHQLVRIDVEQGGGRGGALDVAPDLYELPALAVVHRRVGDALEKVRTLLYRAEEFVRGDIPDVVEPRLLDLQKEPVELLPHLGADLLAHLPQVLARGGDAGHDGGLVRDVERHRLGDAVGVARTRQRRRRVQAVEQTPPTPLDRRRRLVEHQVQTDVYQARRVLGALEITARPVKTVCDS